MQLCFHTHRHFSFLPWVNQTAQKGAPFHSTQLRISGVSLFVFWSNAFLNTLKLSIVHTINHLGIYSTNTQVVLFCLFQSNCICSQKEKKLKQFRVLKKMPKNYCGPAQVKSLNISSNRFNWILPLREVGLPSLKHELSPSEETFPSLRQQKSQDWLFRSIKHKSQHEMQSEFSHYTDPICIKKSAI